MVAEKITLSVIKADVGGYVGHCSMHPALMDTAKGELNSAKEDGVLTDFHVLRCGDDLELIMTHRKGVKNSGIHKMAQDTFVACTEVARELKLYGISDAFSGNMKGMGYGVAEIEFIERESEPVVVFMTDKASPGAWNLPLFRIFADPFNTAGLVIDPSMHDGFVFEVLDAKEGKTITLSCPEEMYDLLAFIGTPHRYMINTVNRKATGEVGAAASTQKADKNIGKNDPVLIVRCQNGFPAVGEVLEAFAFPHLVEGWMRGSHQGPLMPVPFYEANPSRFDGPPRVIAAGFQLANGKLIGPHDMFDDPSFDETRKQANIIGEYMRRHGPFEPHRLPMDAMEQTNMPKIMDKLKGRFKKV
ncbi:MAG: fructose-1,6-bisphosphate aldolase/phosphatase [Thermodesulfobacteriota bacterium]